MDEPEPIVVAAVRTTPAPTPLTIAEAEPEPEPEEPDDRSEWQIRFAEHFTPEVVSTEDSYTSPNLSITVSHHTMETDKGPVVYHLADIYIGCVDCFRSALAATPPRFHMSASLLDMLEEQNGVLAVNGDFCSFSYGGVSVRNGVIWSSSRGTVDLCALYRDGTMETFSPRAFDLDGGGSSMMAFQGALVSQIYSDVPRNLSDCVLIADVAPLADGGKETGT